MLSDKWPSNENQNLCHGVQRSFVWINELLILSLTLKNVYTCRLARLISPMGSLWIYCKRFLRFLSDPDRLSVFYSVSRSYEPSVSWFAVYRKCNETVTRQNNPFFERFSTGFDALTTNTSPLDPVFVCDLKSNRTSQICCHMRYPWDNRNFTKDSFPSNSSQFSISATILSKVLWLQHYMILRQFARFNHLLIPSYQLTHPSLPASFQSLTSFDAFYAA